MTRSVVVTTWFPDSSHPSRTPFCLEHVLALKRAGIDVQVIHVRLRSVEPPLVETYNGVAVTRASLGAGRPASWWRTTRAIHRALRTADVLHTMAFSSVVVAAAAWLLRPRPWVHTEHWNGVVNPRSVPGPWRWVSFLRHVLRLPHVVTGVTQELATELARFSRAGATRVVPCVVHQPEHIADFPQEPPLRLVGVGLLIARKNPLLAIDTIGWLRKHGVDVTLTWVGAGPLMADARGRVRGLGLDEFVTFPGAVEPSQVQPVVEQAHLFFVPSAQENFFTALAEAIAVGRPAVVPRTGGFTEYCTPSNSELVDELRADVLGAAIAKAWARFRHLSPNQVAATVEDRFSPHRVAEDFLRLYDELAPRG